MLDAHVFDGLQEIAKPIVANIVVSWNFEILLFFFFSILCILEVKKHTLFNKFLSQKMATNLTGRKRRRLQRKKGN